MGLDSSKIGIVGNSTPSISARAEGRPFAGHGEHLIKSSLAKAGFDPEQVHYFLVEPGLCHKLNDLKLDLIITLGEQALNYVTGKRGLDKWQASPLDTLSPFACPKVLATYDEFRLNKQYDYRMFFYKTFQKAAKSMYKGPWKRKSQNFTLITEPEDILAGLQLLEGHEILSVDIETSQGTINTMGFAWTTNDAVAFRVEPSRYPAELEHMFWTTVAKYMENPAIKKVLQNNVYEATYFSRYGIRMVNVWHDTMWAQKLMYPEFKQGLDIIGQLFTNEIYWKEDGKDWGNIDNWRNHLEYNCKDTTNTLEACLNQREELKERGMLDFFDNYMMKLAEPINEMCSTGLDVNDKLRTYVETEVHDEIKELIKGLSKPLNHRSSKQKMELFEGKGYAIPKIRNSTGKFSKSVNEVSLKKLRLKYPQDEDIKIFLRLAKLEKFISSYVEFDSHADGKVRYTIRGSGTETLRFSSSSDSWDMGFNAQTIPKKAKKFFTPPFGHKFMQVDLKQAESRYVAYKANDTMLIKMLEDPNEDVHSYVASKVFDVTQEQVIAEKNAGDPSKRQLGKKSGHGANYSMRAATFQDSCLKEDLVISKKEAENILETYHSLFPGLRKWHKSVQDQLNDCRWLENPLGFRRYFYGRMDDNTYREAYAFEPQSTIPMITNHLMIYLYEQREKGLIKCNFHLQVHDSVVISVEPQWERTIAKICLNTDLWHPKITFPVGDLIIPTEVELGDNLADMKEYTP